MDNRQPSPLTKSEAQAILVAHIAFEADGAIRADEWQSENGYP